MVAFQLLPLLYGNANKNKGHASKVESRGGLTQEQKSEDGSAYGKEGEKQ